MASTTTPATPNTTPATPNVETTPKAPVSLTPTAVGKVKEIMSQQNPVPAGLRIGVVGGGCSGLDRKSTRLNSSHANISYAVFCLKKEKRPDDRPTTRSSA